MRVVRAERAIDDAMRLGLERHDVALVLGAGRRLGVVERPLVELEDRLLGLGLDLGAQLHALGEDDLLLRGEQRHAADLAQVQAHGVVGVEDLGRDRLGLGVLVLGGRGRGGRRRGGVGAGSSTIRAASASSSAALGSSSMDAAASSASVSVAGEVEWISGNHDAPIDDVAPSHATSWDLDQQSGCSGRTVSSGHAARHT